MTGVKTYHDYDPMTKKSIIGYEFRDASPAVDYAQSLANDGDYTRDGMKRSMLHGAHIPASAQLKMLIEDGVDVLNPDHTKKLLYLLETKYSNLKTTPKKLIIAK